jgi:surface carbohydrate biosynthesis protein
VNTPTLKYYSENKGKTLDIMDAYFSWGTAPSEAMKTRYPDNKSKIYVTGNPKFDLLVKELHDAYANNTKSETYGDYIQMNMSFPWGNPFDRKKRRSAVRKRYPDQDIPAKEQFYARIFYLFIELIIYLNGNTSQNIIVRPHPGEDFDMYEKTIGHLNEVYIRPFDDPRSWIYESNGVIHFDSTTGIESALMEKPVLSYQPIPDTIRGESDILSQLVSDTATSREEVIKWVETYAMPDNTHTLNNDQRERLMGYFPNITKLAAPQICDIVEPMIADSTGFSGYRVPVFKRLSMRAKNSVAGERIVGAYDNYRGLKEKIKGENNNYKKMRVKRRQKFPGLGRSELKSKMSCFLPKIDVSSITINKVPRTRHSYTIRKTDN